MRSFLASFLVSLVACLALTPLVLRFAVWTGAIDAGRGLRRVHAREVPRLGGLAIVGAFYVPLIAMLFVDSSVGRQFMADRELVVGLIGGSVVIAILGVWDDVRGVRPALKLAVQGSIAVVVVALGFRIDVLNLPLVGTLELGILAWPITILWIVGITNAVNLIDGLDGLAAGVALFGILPVVVIAVANGHVYLGLVACCLLGSLLGFLVYNFHPARIFMGDTGSMFLGYVLAVITVKSSVKGAAAISMLVPVLALGLPIMDTLLTVARRAWIGMPVMRADRGHIHHRLLDLGISHRRAVMLLYLFAAAFAAAAIAVHFASAPHAALVVLLTTIVASILLRRLGYMRLRLDRIGSELRGAGQLRLRNRMAQRDLRALRRELGRAHTLPEVVELAESLGRIAAATGVHLRLDDSGPRPRRREWTWSLDSEQRRRELQEFPMVTPDGAVFGQIAFAWYEGAQPPAEILAILEEGCALLAAAIDRATLAEAEAEAAQRVVPFPRPG